MLKFVQYGAGNIGRGFIGPLFSQAGYEVVFIDINRTVVDRLNADRAYPIRIVSDAGAEEILIRNVRAVNGLDTEKVAEEIASADIMATSVGVNVLPHIAPLLAAGFRRRWALSSPSSPRPLDVLLCENLHHAGRFMANLLKEQLAPEDIPLLDRHIGWVEASIGRMVPVMTEEMQAGNPLRVVVEAYCELPVDRDAFRGPIPAVPHLMPASPFAFYVDRKLYIHNMGHATAAYLGQRKGYTYIWEAVENPEIRSACLAAMDESASALALEYGQSPEDLRAHAEDLVRRFGNRQLGDTVDRVGRDTLRKLAPEDRLVGAANLCLKKGLFPRHILTGIAAALHFQSDDPGTAAVLETVREGGPEKALRELCRIDPASQTGREILARYTIMKG